MKVRHLYYLPATVFTAFAVLQYNDQDGLFWAGIYIFVALCNILAAMNKLYYTLVILGFSLLLFLITSSFPSTENWGIKTEEGKEFLGLIIACNWMALLGIFKLYKDSYK